MYNEEESSSHFSFPPPRRETRRGLVVFLYFAVVEKIKREHHLRADLISNPPTFATGTPSRSAWTCIRVEFTVIPPSTRRVEHLIPSPSMARKMSTTWGRKRGGLIAVTTDCGDH